MGLFYTDVTIRHVADRTRSAVTPQVLVDTGSEATWIPAKVLEGLGVQRVKKDRAYTMANGQRITRTVGYAIVEVAPNYETVDEVVFAEEGDLVLLGSRSLEGLGVRIDPEGKQLVAAGPSPAAGHVRVE